MPDKISSLSHPLVKHLCELRQDSSYRALHNTCLVMGSKAIEQAMTTCSPLRLLSEADATPAIFKKITALPHPEPCIAEFPLPAPSSLLHLSSLIVIDRLSDPGNVGNILRTALALGWGGVFFLAPTVDPFNDKVLRASKAALFRLPYQQGASLHHLLPSFTPLIADTEGTPLHHLPPISRPLLILSNEASGVDPHHLGTKVTIPMQQMESLNVASAGAILMYALRSSDAR